MLSCYDADICFNRVSLAFFFSRLGGGVTIDYNTVPRLGYSDILDAVAYLLRLSLDLLTAGRIDEAADSEFIRNLEWYNDLPSVLGGNYS